MPSDPDVLRAHLRAVEAESLERAIHNAATELAASKRCYADYFTVAQAVEVASRAGVPLDRVEIYSDPVGMCVLSVVKDA